MAITTFSGPVASQNGFIGGTSSDPTSVTTASNITSFYGTTSATSGDTRLNYSKLTFTAAGAGETIRAYSVITGAQGAGQTTNGAHISCDVNTGGSISGAANALRATLGGTATTPGGTLAVLQLDTNYSSNVTLGSASAFIRISDSGSQTGEVQNFLNIESGPAATIVGTGTVGGTAKAIKILIGGVAHYITVGTTLT
jgi:hypothetical protein